MKKALFVTTKGWSTDNIKSLKDKVNQQNYRWKAVILKEGKQKFAYFYTKADLEIMAIQEHFTILKVQKL